MSASPRIRFLALSAGLGAALLLACSGDDTPPDLAPSDDPADHDVDTQVSYRIEVTEPRWVVPSDGLPAEVDVQISNANVDIVFHLDRLFMAWRTAPYHFASEDTVLYIVSSLDGGFTWDYEGEVFLGTDMREPRFLSYRGNLQLLFFEAGDNPIAFEPVRMWRLYRHGFADWTEPEIFVDRYEVPWRVKVRNDTAYMTSYAGEHYGGGDAIVEVYFKQSTDGDTWQLVDDQPYVYAGGVSEVAFEFDADGSLWTVTRNEDCDDTGCGSHVCWAPAAALGSWECPTESDPERYDSPDMFRHGDDIYLVARRDIGGPFGPEGDLMDYSTRPKTTALYQIDKATRTVVRLMDLPGCGDNAFPSVRRTSEHSFLMANYTSPLDEPDISWLAGQTSARGTQLYFLEITFVPEP
ncbi:MAG: hypothetical protein ABI333_18560 [bacterium]